MLLHSKKILIQPQRSFRPRQMRFFLIWKNITVQLKIRSVLRSLSWQKRSKIFPRLLMSLWKTQKILFQRLKLNAMRQWKRWMVLDRNLIRRSASLILKSINSKTMQMLKWMKSAEWFLNLLEKSFLPVSSRKQRLLTEWMKNLQLTKRIWNIAFQDLNLLVQMWIFWKRIFEMLWMKQAVVFWVILINLLMNRRKNTSSLQLQLRKIPLLLRMNLRLSKIRSKNLNRLLLAA